MFLEDGVVLKGTQQGTCLLGQGFEPTTKVLGSNDNLSAANGFVKIYLDPLFKLQSQLQSKPHWRTVRFVSQLCVIQ